MAKDKDPAILDHTNSDVAPVTRPALKLDLVRYEKMLNNCDLTEQQRQDFLETLWSVIVGFVDLGFEVHPLQQAAPHTCGQQLDLTSFLASDVITSKKGISQKQFTDAAKCSNEQDVERMES